MPVLPKDGESSPLPAATPTRNWFLFSTLHSSSGFDPQAVESRVPGTLYGVPKSFSATLALPQRRSAAAVAITDNGPPTTSAPSLRLLAPLFAGLRRHNLDLLQKCLALMRLVVGDAPSVNHSNKLWKRQRSAQMMMLLLRVDNINNNNEKEEEEEEDATAHDNDGDDEDSGGAFVDQCVAEGTLQSLLVAVLFLVVSSSSTFVVLGPLTRRFLNIDPESVRLATADLAVRLLRRSVELGSIFAATASLSLLAGGSSKTEMALASPKACMARPMVFLLLHGVLSVLLPHRDAAASAAVRLLGLQFWFAEQCELSAESMGLLSSTSTSSGASSSSSSLHAQMNAANVGGQLREMLTAHVGGGNATSTLLRDECALAWTSGLSYLYPAASDQDALFDSLVERTPIAAAQRDDEDDDSSEDDGNDDSAHVLLECLCFKIGQAPGTTAPGVLSRRPVVLGNQLLDSMELAAAAGGARTHGDSQQQQPVQSSAAAPAAPHPPPPTAMPDSPVSSLGGQSAFSTQRRDSADDDDDDNDDDEQQEEEEEDGDDHDEQFSVSSLTNNARSVSSITSSVLMYADTKSDGGGSSVGAASTGVSSAAPAATAATTTTTTTPLLASLTTTSATSGTSTTTTTLHEPAYFELVRPVDIGSSSSVHHRSRLYTFSFLLSLRRASNNSNNSTTHEGASASSSLLVFDEPRVAETIEVLDHGRRAVQKGHKKWGTAISQLCCSSSSSAASPATGNVFKWKIKIDKCDDGHLFFGVATKDAISSGFLGEDQHGWGFLAKANLWHAREKKQSQYGEPVRTGDVLTMTFDARRGTLAFASQRKDFGVAFRNLPADVFPAVALYERGDSVTLVEDKTTIGGGVGGGEDEESEMSQLFWNHLDPLAHLERKLFLANSLFDSLKRPGACALVMADDLLAHIKRVTTSATLLAPLAAVCLLPLEDAPPHVVVDLLAHVLDSVSSSSSPRDSPSTATSSDDMRGAWTFSDFTSRHAVDISSHNMDTGEVAGVLVSKREGQVRITGRFDAKSGTLYFTEAWKAFSRKVVVQVMATCSGEEVGLGWCRVESPAQPPQMIKPMSCQRTTATTTSSHHNNNRDTDVRTVLAMLVGKLVLALTSSPAEQDPAQEETGEETAATAWADSVLFQRFPVAAAAPLLSSTTSEAAAAFLQDTCGKELAVLQSAADHRPPVAAAAVSLPLDQDWRELDLYLLRFAGQAQLAAIGGEATATLRRHTITCLLEQCGGGGALLKEAEQLAIVLRQQQPSVPPPPTHHHVVDLVQEDDASPLGGWCSNSDDEYDDDEDVLAERTRCRADREEDEARRRRPVSDPLASSSSTTVAHSPNAAPLAAAAPPPPPAPSAHLVNVWRAANRVVSWVVREKQQQQQQQPDVTYELVVRPVLARVKFLARAVPATTTTTKGEGDVETRLRFILDRQVNDHALARMEATWAVRAQRAVLRCAAFKSLARALDVLPRHRATLLAWLAGDVLASERVSEVAANAFATMLAAQQDGGQPAVALPKMLTRADFKDAGLLPTAAVGTASEGVDAGDDDEAPSHCLKGLENCGEALTGHVTSAFQLLMKKLVVELELEQQDGGGGVDHAALLKATLFPVRNAADCELATLALPQWKRSEALPLMDALARQLASMPGSSSSSSPALGLLQDLFAHFLTLASTTRHFAHVVNLVYELAVERPDVCGPLLMASSTAAGEWIRLLLFAPYDAAAEEDDAVTCHRGMRLVRRFIGRLSGEARLVRQLFAHVENQHRSAHQVAAVLASESVHTLQSMLDDDNDGARASWRELVDQELERLLLSSGAEGKLAALGVLGGFVEPFRFATKVVVARGVRAAGAGGGGRRLEVGLASQVGEHVEVVFALPVESKNVEEEDDGGGGEEETASLTAPIWLDKADVAPALPLLVVLGRSPRCLEAVWQVLDDVLLRAQAEQPASGGGDNSDNSDDAAAANAEEEMQEADRAALRGAVSRLLPDLLKLTTTASSEEYRERLRKVCEVAVQPTETMGTAQDEHLVALYLEALLRARAAPPKMPAAEQQPSLPSKVEEEAAAAAAPTSVATPSLEENPVLEELMQLDMGFPRELCRLALEHSGNDIEQAIHFCLENAHNADQLLDEYRLSRANQNVGAGARVAQPVAATAAAEALIVTRLAEMGFPRTWCVKGVEHVMASRRRAAAAVQVDAQVVFNQALAWILSNGDALHDQDVAAASSATQVAAGAGGGARDDDEDDGDETGLLPPRRLVVNSGGVHSIRISRRDLAVSCIATAPSSTGGGGTFPTVSARGVALRTHKWYYEVTLQTESCMQIGWCDAMFTGDAFEGNGVGDCAHGWSYDGYRRLRWHNTQQQAWGRQWKVGQTVGCFADLDSGELWFSLDGKWEEAGMGLAFRGLRADKTYVRGLMPAISFNRGERFRVNFGPDFKHSALPPTAVAEEEEVEIKVLPVSAAWGEASHLNVKHTMAPGAAEDKDDDDDYFEEIVGDALLDRYFTAGQLTGLSPALAQLLVKRPSSSTVAASGGAAGGGTGSGENGGRLSTTPPPPAAAAAAATAAIPSSRDPLLPFPEAIGLKKRSISSLNQALDELQQAETSAKDITQALSRVSWTVFTLQARLALAGNVDKLEMLLAGGSDEDEESTVTSRAELVWRLVRVMLLTGVAEGHTLAPVAAGLLKCTSAASAALLRLCNAELHRMARREYALIPWEESVSAAATSTAASDGASYHMSTVLLVHHIWALVVDDNASSASSLVVNERRLGDHPSLHFCLWATQRLLATGQVEVVERRRTDLIALWTKVLRSPGTRIKTVAAQMLIRLVDTPQDVAAFAAGFPDWEQRIGGMAKRLMLRGGVMSIQAMHSKYAMTLCELAATLQTAAREE